MPARCKLDALFQIRVDKPTLNCGKRANPSNFLYYVMEHRLIIFMPVLI